MIRLALCPILCLAFLASPAAQPSAVGRVQQLAPDVYFYEGDISKGHCNNGWVVFEDYVLVIDANYPSGAREVIAKIRELTQKPVRFAFDTHHHGDHAYGNQVWVEQGATPVAHTGGARRDEATRDRPLRRSAWPVGRRSEESRRPSRLEAEAADAALSRHADFRRWKAPRRAAALRHGAYEGRRRRVAAEGEDRLHRRHGGERRPNFVGDGNVASWIPTLAKVAALGPSKVGPGHGPLGDAAVIEDQALYFKELTAAVTTASTGQDGRGRAGGDSGDAGRACEERAHHEVPRRRLRGARRKGLQRDHRRHAARSTGRDRRGARSMSPGTTDMHTTTRERTNDCTAGQDRDVRERGIALLAAATASAQSAAPTPTKRRSATSCGATSRRASAATPVRLETLFTADADQLVSSGEWRRGRDGVVKGGLASSARNTGARTIVVETVRMLGPTWPSPTAATRSAAPRRAGCGRRSSWLASGASGGSPPSAICCRRHRPGSPPTPLTW